MASLLHLLVVQVAVGVIPLLPADLFEVAYLGAVVTLVIEGLALLFTDFSGSSGSVPSLPTPATLLTATLGQPVDN